MPLFSFTWTRTAVLVAVLALSALAAALAVPASAGAAPVTPWVQAQNGHFVDTATGKTTLLRGLDVTVGSGNMYQKAKTTFGANFVRLTPAWEQIEPTAPVNGVHTYDQSFLGTLDAMVAWYQQNNVNVVIDLHQSGWSSYFAAIDGTARGMPPWLDAGKYPVSTDGVAQAKADFFTDPQIKQWYSDLWTMLVNRYSSYPNVVGFEIMNEPQPGALDNATETQELADWQSSIAHQIAAQDPQATVFFMLHGGADYGLEHVDLSAYSDLPHMALDVHSYFNGVGGLSDDGEDWLPSYDESHNQYDTNYQGTVDQQEGTLARTIYGARSHGWPLLVGEWGVRTDDSGAASYQSQMLTVLAHYGLSWTRWSLGNTTTLATLNADMTPNANGQQLVSALASTPTGLQADLPPAISGTLKSGSTLSASKGTWTSTPSSYAYQWYRCDDAGNSCVAISGATGSTYTLTDTDADKRLRVRLNVTASTGSQTALSPATSMVQTLAPSIAALPTISGQVMAGQVLTASKGGWNGKVSSYAYQWLVGDGSTFTTITGATKATYTVKTGDIGNKLEVTVTATGAGGSTAATSVPTAAVLPIPLANTAVPTTTGAATVGTQLVADKGTWTGTVSGYGYQWLSDGTPIAGATSTKYTLAIGDIGHGIQVSVTATGPSSTLAAQSTKTAAVQAAAIKNTALPTTSGAATVGTQLVADKGTWTGTITGYSYQWLSAGSPISGATSSKYTLVVGDIGHAISVKVTATGPGGSTSATSAQTAAVQAVAVKNTALPAITGSAVSGSQLVADKGTWTGTISGYAYQWTSDGVAISGETNSKYTLKPADVGHAISVKVTATGPSSSVTAQSAPTAKVADLAPKNTAAPTLTGTTVLNKTLSLAKGSWSGSNLVYSYRWERVDGSGNATAIGGQTGTSYKLTTADVGFKIRGYVKATNTAGSVEVASALTAAVTAT
jgi:aryl-phospho-beta-D-glucosidase BglC (GH1 family)